MELILKYFPEITQKQSRQFEGLLPLYQEWNSQINVISRKDMDEFYIHHVLHSLGIAKVVSFKKGAHILDIGTGGGFPGIPLAILFPDVQFHLVDSIGKKIKVVDAVAENLQLANVKATHARAEEINGDYDFIVSRAVTQLPRFLPLTKGKLKKSSQGGTGFKPGLFYLKGGEFREELSGLKKPRIFSLSDYFHEEHFETKKVVYLPLV